MTYVPDLRFLKFKDISWKKEFLTKYATKILTKNKNKAVTNVICNSAQLGLIPQYDFFEKNIAVLDNTESYYILNTGDFVYNPRKSNTAPYGPINEYCYKEKGIVSPLYLCFKVNGINDKFLLYRFKSTCWHKYIYLNGDSGARHDRVSIKDDIFLNQPINVPNDEEQKMIGDFIDLISNRIETQKKIISKYESLIKTINDIHFETIINKRKFKELYIKAKEGGTPDTKKADYYVDGNIPFIKIDDLGNKYILSNKSFITDEGLTNSSAWIVPENSILFSNGATIGEVAINRYPLSTKQGILGVVPNDKIITEYMYYLMKSKTFRREIIKITTKGTMDAAYIKDIDEIMCPLESVEKQQKYILNVNKIFSLLENEKKILSLYEKQKQHLLNHMFI